MTDYTMTHPLWMWRFFGVFGSLGAVLFTLTMWHAMKSHARAKGQLRSAVRWTMLGFMFLFFGAWFGCGIGATPGNLLSPDPAAHNLYLANFEAVLSMFFSVPGWACLLMGQRRMLKGIQSLSR
jgi:Na+/proline symporter